MIEDLIRLAKFFDKCILVGKSFVLTEEVKVIKEAEDGKGIEVITPYGSFNDSNVTFDRLKENIKLVQQTIEQVKPEIKKEQKPKINSSVEELTSSTVETIPQAKNNLKKKFPQTVNIPIEAGQSGNCEGTIPLDPRCKIVDRQDLVVMDSSGVILGTGSPGGTVTGTIVSGIVFENGKYRLAFKGYSGNMAVVQYVVQGK